MYARLEDHFNVVMLLVVLFSMLMYAGALFIGTLGDEYGSPPWDQAGARYSPSR
jgi:hypothetical protein